MTIRKMNGDGRKIKCRQNNLEMKPKLILIAVLAGIAFTGCNSNSKTENLTDSALVDTIMPVDSVVVDTTPIRDTLLVDSLQR